MSKRDWKQLQTEYAKAFEGSGVSVRVWCESKGINYNTGRRYLNASAQKSDHSKKVRKSGTQSPNTPQKTSAKRNKGKSGNETGSGASPYEIRVHVGDGAKSDHQSDQKSDHSNFARNLMNVKPEPKVRGRPFEMGNTAAVKHSGYARRLNDADAIFDAQETNINEEIVFCRARTLKAMETYTRIEEELANPDTDTKSRVKLYDLFLRTDTAVDRNMQRVESLLKTAASVEKTKLESERLAAESAGLGTAIADIVGEIQAMEGDGFV